MLVPIQNHLLYQQVPHLAYKRLANEVDWLLLSIYLHLQPLASGVLWDGEVDVEEVSLIWSGK